MSDDYTPCGLGSCAAPEGHDGTCAQASGWDRFTDDAKEAAYEAGFAAGRMEGGEPMSVTDDMVAEALDAKASMSQLHCYLYATEKCRCGEEWSDAHWMRFILERALSCAEWEAEQGRSSAVQAMSAYDDGHAAGYAEGRADALAEQGETEWEYGYELVESDARDVLMRGFPYGTAREAGAYARRRAIEEHDPEYPAFDPLVIRLREAEAVIEAVRQMLPRPMSEPLSRDFTGRPFPRIIDGDTVAAILSRYKPTTENGSD